MVKKYFLSLFLVCMHCSGLYLIQLAQILVPVCDTVQAAEVRQIKTWHRTKQRR